MASVKKSRAGYEPAKGFPDPEDPRPPPAAGILTHRPGASGGPACPPHVRGNVVPTSAESYIDIHDPAAMPTCPWCARYHQAVTDDTARRYPWATSKGA